MGRRISTWGGAPFVHDILRFVGILLLGGGAAGVLAGWGLLDRQAWARTLSIVLACFALLLFMPLGTLLGIYTLWVLCPRNPKRNIEKSPAPRSGCLVTASARKRRLRQKPRLLSFHSLIHQELRSRFESARAEFPAFAPRTLR